MNSGGMRFFRQTWLKILIVVILVLGVGRTAAHLFRTRQNQLNAFSQPTPSSQVLTGTRFSPTIFQPSLTPLPDRLRAIGSTASWKTYVNTGGWQIKYPPDWRVTDNLNGSVSMTSPDFQYNDNNRVEQEATSGASVLYYTNQQASLSAVKVGEIAKAWDTPDRININLKELTIDGQPAQEWDYHDVGNTQVTRTVIEILKGGKALYFNATYASPALKKLFEQMLATFSFLDRTKVH